MLLQFLENALLIPIGNRISDVIDDGLNFGRRRYRRACPSTAAAIAGLRFLRTPTITDDYESDGRSVWRVERYRSFGTKGERG